MKNALVITAAAAFLTSVMVPAFAQDAGAGAGAGVTVETPAVGAKVGADVKANANAGGVADQTYGSVVSSVAGSADVDLSTVAEALTANAEAVTKLHTNIAANAAIKAKLEADGHSADDVVAVKSNADGSVIVYIDDRA